MLVKMPEKTTCIPARKRASAQNALAIWKSEPNPDANKKYLFPDDTEYLTVTEEAVTQGA